MLSMAYSLNQLFKPSSYTFIKLYFSDAMYNYQVAPCFSSYSCLLIIHFYSGRWTFCLAHNKEGKGGNPEEISLGGFPELYVLWSAITKQARPGRRRRKGCRSLAGKVMCEGECEEDENCLFSGNRWPCPSQTSWNLMTEENSPRRLTTLSEWRRTTQTYCLATLWQRTPHPRCSYFLLSF